MGYVQERLMSSSNYRYDERSFQDGDGLDYGILGCVHVAYWQTASPKDVYEKTKKIRSERSVIICSLKQREVILPTLDTFAGQTASVM
jgi:hypothetical protein